MADDDLLGRYRALVDSDEAHDESVLQEFFERNPAMLPGSHSLDGNSGHPPWAWAVISQPRLPELSTKRPDFMWIAVDSTFVYPILIEIETPYKRWWHSEKVVEHSELTAARSQVTHWRRWFAQHGPSVFCDTYQLDRNLRELTLAPRYVIIHGRRNEASKGRSRSETRGGLTINDSSLKLWTFDHLVPDPLAARYFTVRVDDEGYHVHPNSPPVDEAKLPDEVRHLIIDFDSAAAGPRPGHRFAPPKPR